MYISVLGNEKEKNDTLAALAKANGFIRREIGSRIRLRKTPEMIFEMDEALEYGNRIETILKDLNK